MLEPLHLKETLTQVPSCEYCEFFKNTYFEEHLRAAASELSALACFFFFLQTPWSPESFFIVNTYNRALFLIKLQVQASIAGFSCDLQKFSEQLFYISTLGCCFQI